MGTRISGSTGINRVENNADMPSGCVIQVQRTEVGVQVTGTTIIPFDNTIPQSNEGVLVMQASITPKKANSLLKIEAISMSGASLAGHLQMALFKNSEVNAISATSTFMASSGITTQCITKYVQVTDLSTLTFSVRVGGQNTGTFQINGYNGAQYMGGVGASSITITEIEQ